MMNASSPANEHTKSGTTSSFPNRFSNTSFLSLSSVRTLLPQYSPTVEGPSSSEPSSADTGSTISPISSSFRNRFSNASFLSLSSVRALLPQYSVVDTLEDPPASPLGSEGTTESQSCAPSSRNSQSAIEPPRYSVLQPRQSLMLTSSAGCTEIGGDHGFRYSYPIRPKNPWATLHLHTRVTVPGDLKSLQNQPRVPRFWSCNPITGIVQLDLDSPQNIQQISITLNGNIILSFHAGGDLPFLKREFTVWDKSVDDPLHSDNAGGNQKKKIDSRLVAGQHMFPFSFPFPTQTDPVLDTDSISPFRPHRVRTTLSDTASPTSLPYDTGLQNTEKRQRSWTRRSTSDESPSSSKRSQASAHHPHTPPGSERRSFTSLPQTFMEKGIDPNVTYDISVRIVHGRFKSSSKIKTPVAYFPASEPPPVSQKRREAYETGALIPCPMDDPEGWFALPRVKTYGVIKIGDNLVHTKVDCALYIAKPLSYTRGSLIPCFITIYSDGVEVEHLLPSTTGPTVRLLRRLWHPMADCGAQPAGVNTMGNPTTITSWTYTIVPTSNMNLVTHEVGCANWWMPSKDIVQGPNVRHLAGEIHLSPDLQPSCGFQSFRIEYAVELLSFQTANFKPEIRPPSPGKLEDDVIIASNPVEITTLYRLDEPVPIAYSEPPHTHRKPVRISPDKGTNNFQIRE